MEDIWDLTILYSGFDDPSWQDDLAAYDKAAADLNALAEAAADLPHSELLHCYLAAAEAAKVAMTRLSLYASLRYSADTADSQAVSMTGMLLGKMSESTAAEAVLHHAIADCADLDALLDSDPALAEYRYLLSGIRRDARYLLSDREEALLARMNISGAAAWSDLQSSLTSTVTARYRGETLSLSQVRNLAYEADPLVRRDAYEAELACYPKIQDAVAFALNSIKLQVIHECRLRGYASPLDQALKQSRMKRETLDALLDAMKAYLPKFRKYLRAKARALGHENGLPWWDLFAPMGRSDRKFTVPQARDYLLNVFGGFDSQLRDMVQRAFSERWIDFFPRSGKVGGAFDCGIPSAGQSRVLTNFDGAFGSVVTLAHELGHAFHDQQSFAHSPLTQDYSMPVAETASTFNEVLVVSTALQQAEDKAEKLNLLENQLMDACQIICDIYARYLFETAVFDAREEEFLSAGRLCEMMLDAQKAAYGDGLDPQSLHPYMWLCKSHYYSGDLSFYNFPYAFGGLFARGLYARYRAMGDEFVPLYKRLLYATSVTDVEDCAAIAGADITDRRFWCSALDMLAGEIDEFCELVDA